MSIVLLLAIPHRSSEDSTSDNFQFTLQGSSLDYVKKIFPEIVHINAEQINTVIGIITDYPMYKYKAIRLSLKKYHLTTKKLIIHYSLTDQLKINSNHLQNLTRNYMVRMGKLTKRNGLPHCCVLTDHEFAQIIQESNPPKLTEAPAPLPEMDFNKSGINYLGWRKNEADDKWIRDLHLKPSEDYQYSHFSYGEIYTVGQVTGDENNFISYSVILIRLMQEKFKYTFKVYYSIKTLLTRPDSEFFVLLSEENLLYLYNHSGVLLFNYDLDQHFQNVVSDVDLRLLDFSNDGNKFLFLNKGSPYILNQNSQLEKLILPQSDGYILHGTISSANNSITLVGNLNDIFIIKSNGVLDTDKFMSSHGEICLGAYTQDDIVFHVYKSKIAIYKNNMYINTAPLHGEEKLGFFQIIGHQFFVKFYKRKLSIFTITGKFINRIQFPGVIGNVYWGNDQLNVEINKFIYSFSISPSQYFQEGVLETKKNAWQQLLDQCTPADGGMRLLTKPMPRDWKINILLYENRSIGVIAKFFPFENDENYFIEVRETVDNQHEIVIPPFVFKQLHGPDIQHKYHHKNRKKGLLITYSIHEAYILIKTIEGNITLRDNKKPSGYIHNSEDYHEWRKVLDDAGWDSRSLHEIGINISETERGLELNINKTTLREENDINHFIEALETSLWALDVFFENVAIGEGEHQVFIPPSRVQWFDHRPEVIISGPKNIVIEFKNMPLVQTDSLEKLLFILGNEEKDDRLTLLNYDLTTNERNWSVTNIIGEYLRVDLQKKQIRTGVSTIPGKKYLVLVDYGGNVLERNPYNTSELISWAEQAKVMGEFHKANSMLLDALKLEGDNKSQAGILRSLGEIAEEVGDFRKAISYYLKALKINPRIGVQKKISILDKSSKIDQ